MTLRWMTGLSLLLTSPSVLAQDEGGRPNCKECFRQPGLGRTFQCDYPPTSSNIPGYSDCHVSETYKGSDGHYYNDCDRREKCIGYSSTINGRQYVVFDSHKKCNNSLVNIYRGISHKSFVRV